MNENIQEWKHFSVNENTFQWMKTFGRRAVFVKENIYIGKNIFLSIISRTHVNNFCSLINFM